MLLSYVFSLCCSVINQQMLNLIRSKTHCVTNYRTLMWISVSCLPCSYIGAPGVLRVKIIYKLILIKL